MNSEDQLTTSVPLGSDLSWNVEKALSAARRVLGCDWLDVERGFPAMSDSAESVVRNYFAALTRSDLDLDEVGSFFSDDAVFIDGPRGTHQGIDAIKTELQSMAKMISSINIEVKALVANGGTVMTERVDTFEIQGKPFAIEVAAVFEVGSDSRIMRWRDYYDLRSLEDRIAAALAPPS